MESQTFPFQDALKKISWARWNNKFILSEVMEYIEVKLKSYV